MVRCVGCNACVFIKDCDSGKRLQFADAGREINTLSRLKLQMGDSKKSLKVSSSHCSHTETELLQLFL